MVKFQFDTKVEADAMLKALNAVLEKEPGKSRRATELQLKEEFKAKEELKMLDSDRMELSPIELELVTAVVDRMKLINEWKDLRKTENREKIDIVKKKIKEIEQKLDTDNEKMRKLITAALEKPEVKNSACVQPTDPLMVRGSDNTATARYLILAVGIMLIALAAGFAIYFTENTNTRIICGSVSLLLMTCWILVMIFAVYPKVIRNGCEGEKATIKTQTEYTEMLKKHK